MTQTKVVLDHKAVKVKGLTKLDQIPARILPDLVVLIDL